jgi:ferric enterobactin receptor
MKEFTATIFTLLLLINGGLAQVPSTEQDAGPVITTQQQQIAATGWIEGTVIDEETAQPLEFATISVFRAEDKELVNGGISDEKGVFKIKVNTGTYFVTVEFISYEAIEFDNVVIEGSETTNLGEISIHPSIATLAEVEVRAERSTFEMALDKKVFNVGQDLANAGGSALDILDNVPSLNVDIEGNIELRGSGGVRILVDGKPSSLVGVGDSDGLRNLPAESIERIEVINNPSARYEAEGMSGIINIVMRKSQQKGVNGTLSASAGYPDNYRASANVNFRKTKINWFGRYSISYHNNPGGGFLYQELYEDDQTFILDQTNDSDRSRFGNDFAFGVDYYFDPKTTLTGSFQYRVDDQESNSEIIYRDYIDQFPQNLVGTTIRTDDEKEDESDTEFELRFRREFSSREHVLTFDIQYDASEEQENSDFIETSYDGDGVLLGDEGLIQRSSNVEDNSDWDIQLDYVKPIGEDGKFEVGARASLRTIGNNYLVEEYLDDAWERLGNFSNDFFYSEDIYSAYASFGNKYGKFSFQSGLRAEISEVDTRLAQTGEESNRSYADLFPTIHLTYDVGETNAVQVSYSRRINRPRFWYLNPFFTFSDARNIRTGNPNLDPVYTNSYELQYILYGEVMSLTTALYHRYSTGVIERIRTVDESDGSSLTRPLNIAEENSYGLEFTYSINPTEWMRLNGDLNFFRSIREGGEMAPGLRSDAYSWSGRITSQIEFWKDANLQVRFNYRAPRNTVQGRRKARIFADFGLSKDVLKRRGTLTLSIRDPFNTQKHRYIYEGENFYSEGEHRWRRGQQFSLRFSYRLSDQRQRRRDGEGFERGEMQGGEEFNFDGNN